MRMKTKTRIGIGMELCLFDTGRRIFSQAFVRLADIIENLILFVVLALSIGSDVIRFDTLSGVANVRSRITKSPDGRR